MEYILETVATFTCNFGFAHLGDKATNCLGDHTWTESEATSCQGIVVFDINQSV